MPGLRSRSLLRSPAPAPGCFCSLVSRSITSGAQSEHGEGASALHSGRSNGVRREQSCGRILPGGFLQSRQSNCQVGSFPPLSPVKEMCAVQYFVFILILEILYCWCGIRFVQSSESSGCLNMSAKAVVHKDT